MTRWLLLFALAACRPPDIDLDGRDCPCVTGYVCEATTNKCVRELSPDGAIDVATLGDFSTPAKIAELSSNSSHEDDPSATADLLEIYVDSDRAGGLGGGDIFVSKRATRSDAWGPLLPVMELLSAGDDSSPEVSLDGLRIYFASDRLTPGNRDIWFSSRPDRNSPWSAPMILTAVSTSSAEEGAACEIRDGLGLLVHSNRFGTGDILYTSRTAIGAPWGSLSKVVGLSNGAISENQMFANQAATSVYYVSPMGGFEHIFSATCASPMGPCSNQQLVPVINVMTESDADPWLTEDQRTIIFASYRGGTSDIYMATR